jgi:hypothetical protein
MLLTLLVGCAPIIKYGSPHEVDRLDSLNRGITSKADVLKAIGEPRGYGQVYLAPDLEPRKIWFYEYTEVQGKKIVIKILLVFFDEELYDGYLWFSSAQFLEIEE